jgi:hypothetical protein
VDIRSFFAFKHVPPAASARKNTMHVKNFTPACGGVV